MAESKAHRKHIRQALKDENLQIALNRAESAYRAAREVALDGFDLVASQGEVRSLKERCIAGMDELLARFRQEAEGVGAVVYEAADADDVARIVKQIACERGVKSIVKSKSMLTEELELNKRLIESGLSIVETDLGEWIIQLAGEKPSHFTMPAMHKTREQIAELFSKTIGEEVEPDVQKLVEIARRKLRQAFIDADMGISGANIAIAETGTLALVSNEGNAQLVTTLPPIHVAIVGYEKLVENLDDAAAILKVLSKSATGQKQTAYVSMITGPSRTTDIEKTLALGVHGPRELHIIFVDAGRRKMAADAKCKEALYCIKCGACLNLCPVYRSIGGHAYGNVYMGGIGAVVTAFHHSLDASEDTLGLCTGCGYCKKVCPSTIDTPGMTLELKKRLVDAHGLSLTEKLPLALVSKPKLFESAIKAVRAVQWPILRDNGTVRDLPILGAMMAGRKMPGLAAKFLREILPERSESKGAITVALYAGCMIDYVFPRIGQAIWDVLTKSGVSVIFPKDQGCCGAPAIYSGDQSSARKLAIENLITLENGSPDYIVTGCPTCAVILKDKYGALLQGTQYEKCAVQMAAKVMDFAEFAADILCIKPAIQTNTRVTYHDPCHQVRSLKTSDRSRVLIQKTGAELVEMACCDECCGFAGSFAFKQPGVSSAILNRKLVHIEQTDAQIVATDCPGCIMQLQSGLLDRCAIEVRHTAELIADVLKK